MSHCIPEDTHWFWRLSGCRRWHTQTHSFTTSGFNQFLIYSIFITSIIAGIVFRAHWFFFVVSRKSRDFIVFLIYFYFAKLSFPILTNDWNQINWMPSACRNTRIVQTPNVIMAAIKCASCPCHLKLNYMSNQTIVHLIAEIHQIGHILSCYIALPTCSASSIAPYEMLFVLFIVILMVAGSILSFLPSTIFRFLLLSAWLISYLLLLLLLAAHHIRTPLPIRCLQI